MALLKDRIGAQSQDGINAKIGMTFLTPNRTLLVLPLQEKPPTDPDEMLAQGEATYSIDKMFQAIKPSVEVSLSTGDEANPLEDVEVNFRSIKDFEPETITDTLPLLRGLKEQQNLIGRLEQLMQEGTFAKIANDPSKKEALTGFLKSVLAELDKPE
jgi:hypothetical protein